MDDKVKEAVKHLPMCTIAATPRDGAKWVDRLKEEYQVWGTNREHVLAHSGELHCLLFLLVTAKIGGFVCIVMQGFVCHSCSALPAT